jgi:hypothetical protein
MQSGSELRRSHRHCWKSRRLPYRQQLNLGHQLRVRRHHTGDALLPVGEVRTNPKPPSPANSHSLHTPRESCDRTALADCERYDHIALEDIAAIEVAGIAIVTRAPRTERAPSPTCKFCMRKPPSIFRVYARRAGNGSGTAMQGRRRLPQRGLPFIPARAQDLLLNTIPLVRVIAQLHGCWLVGSPSQHCRFCHSSGCARFHSSMIGMKLATLLVS